MIKCPLSFFVGVRHTCLCIRFTLRLLKGERVRSTSLTSRHQQGYADATLDRHVSGGQSCAWLKAPPKRHRQGPSPDVAVLGATWKSRHGAQCSDLHSVMLSHPTSRERTYLSSAPLANARLLEDCKGAALSNLHQENGAWNQM